MARINFTHHDTYNSLGVPIGAGIPSWYDPAKCERFDEGSYWDGQNLFGTCSRSQWVDQTLYRTQSGRWVLNTDSTRYHDGPDLHRYLSDEEARDWLIRSEVNEEALERLFGPEPDEPPAVGRPEIGPAISIKVPVDMLARIDAEAAALGIARAEWIRRACAAALG